MKFSKETKEFINQHFHDNLQELILKKDKFPNLDMSFIAQQIEGRRKAKEKLPEISQLEDFIFPKKESMEQCSSEYTARYKASLIKNAMLADLTGGLGIDSYYFAENNKKVFHIERNPELQKIAEYNFNATKKNNIESLSGDAIGFLKTTDQFFDVIYLDPARRDNSKKVFLFQDCEPNILDIESLLFSKTKKVLVKASPFLDISKAINDLKTISKIHIVSVKNECKELLIEWEQSSNPSTIIHCINILSSDKIQQFIFSNDEEKSIEIAYSSDVLNYLYEPNTSVIKSGGYKSFGEHFQLKKLHPNSHLFTSDMIISDFQGKSFIVEEVFSVNKKDIEKHLPSMKANIIAKNFPMSVEEIRRKFKIKDGGDTYFFFTTLNNNKKVIIKANRITLE